MFRSGNLIYMPVNYAVQVTPQKMPSVVSFERKGRILCCILYTSVIVAWESTAKPNLQIFDIRRVYTPTTVRPFICSRYVGITCSCGIMPSLFLLPQTEQAKPI